MVRFQSKELKKRKEPGEERDSTDAEGDNDEKKSKIKKTAYRGLYGNWEIYTKELHFLTLFLIVRNGSFLKFSTALDWAPWAVAL